MASSSLLGFILLGIFLSAVITQNHLTEAKRSRIYREKRRPAPVVDGSGAILEGNCPSAPSGAHTQSSCGGDDFLKTCSVSCKEGYSFPGRTKHFKFDLTCDETEAVWKSEGVPKAGVPDCNPICPVGCFNGGTCTAPDVCTCPPGFEGKDCKNVVKIQCERILTPSHAGLVGSGSEVGSTVKAYCQDGYFFPGGQTKLTYECIRGTSVGSGKWHPIDGQGDLVPDGKFPDACLKADCDPDFCKNGGTCIGKNKCLCPPGYHGPQCEYEACKCPKAPLNGEVTSIVTADATICEFKCLDNFQLSGSATRFTCSKNGVWTPSAPPFPTCSAVTQPPTLPTTMPQPVTPSKPPVVDPDSDGFCYSYCQSSYRTFDNKKYNFNGKCRYVLAKDCVDNTFEIQVINDPLCDQGSDCHRSIYIKSGSSTVILEYSDGKVKVSDDINSFKLPWTVQNMEINEVGDMVEVTNDLGFVLRYDKEQFVSVEITKNSLKTKMCGLCGNYDGYSTNDFNAAIDGQKRSSATSFGIANKVGVCDDGATSSYCSADKKKDAVAFCQNLKKGNFSSCASLVNTDEFESACVESVCRYGDAGSTSSSCCAFEALVRECIRKGGKGAGLWRTKDFCPANCPAGQIYDDCGSNCVKTCQNTKSHCISTQCQEGCRCPDDKVLHNGQCIDASSCPCVDGGKEFEEGSNLKRDCNTCTCKGGSWECTKNKCDAICEGNGDPHYRTFDGKNYDFMGDCSYYLVKSPNVTIKVENVGCGPKNIRPLSCTKSIRIIVGTTDIKLLRGKGNVQINDAAPSKRSEFRNDDVFYHSVGSIWSQIDILDYGVAVQWDGVMAFKVIVPPSFMGMTKGLCGTYNKHQKDDFLTPGGDVETDASRFGHSWRTEDCGPIDRPPPCKEPALSVAQSVCSVLQGDDFKACHSSVSVLPALKNCITDHCFCAETDPEKRKKCICNDLRRYADDCERSGHGVGDWRAKVPYCAVTCPPGKVFKRCVKGCKDTCAALSLGTDGCKDTCTEGCECPDGKVEDKNGNCVPVSECGCHKNGMDYNKGESVNDKDENGHAVLCVCEGPGWKCGPLPPCKIHEKPTLCANKKCERRCSNLKSDIVCSAQDECVPGCECADNYVRNPKGECVLVEDCGCEHGGKTYPSGGSYKEDCNNCVCNKGTWDCEKCPCAGTCTAWGDSHIETFDGVKYEFAGKCEYVLASLKDIGETILPDFKITMKNVPCGSSGVTCAKTVTVAINIGGKVEKLALTRDGGVSSSSDKIFEVRDVGMYKYIQVKLRGISLIWDKGTIVYIKLDGLYRGKVQGLCGDFDDKDDNEFTPPGELPTAEAHKFADRMKVNLKCEGTEPETPTKCPNNNMELYAKQKCGVIRGPLFAGCSVDPEPYYERCVHDACACDFGGDCECICTAIAVFAQQCAKQGAPIRWRSQELCPIQCPCAAENATAECPCYNPCISITPPPTCLDSSRFDGKNEDLTCDQNAEQCVEGCFVECPPGFIREKPNGSCIKKAKCEGCGTDPVTGEPMKDGDPMDDPCCICKQEDGGGPYFKKCFADDTIRISRPIPASLEGNEKGIKELNICKDGFINGTEPAGEDKIRVKCQCCAPLGPKPTCGKNYKAEVTKGQCPAWKCVCDVSKCEKLDVDKCLIETTEDECCPQVAKCKDENVGEACEDETKVCKDVYDPVCKITCKKCEIQCSNCTKAPIPECGLCEEVRVVHPTGKCGGCCPKFVCVKKTCQPQPTVACGPCQKAIQVPADCGCTTTVCVDKECPVTPSPNVTKCEQVLEVQGECGCISKTVVEKICEVPQPISCEGVCDLVANSTDECGCVSQSCKPHVCPPIMPKQCNDCYHNVTEIDHCGCADVKCEKDDCEPVQPVNCTKCEVEMEGPDEKCGCPGQKICKLKTCPTPTPPTCGECEQINISKDECYCNELTCGPIMCEAYPNPNCTSCEHVESVVTRCGCWEPVCKLNKCPSIEDTSCDLACNHLVDGGQDDCLCQKPQECKKNPCPTQEPVKCNSCQKKVSKTSICGCVSYSCEDLPCQDYPDPNCAPHPECFDKNKTWDDCQCPKYECVKRPVADGTKPKCRKCDKLVETEDVCGRKTFSCVRDNCPDITIPVCPVCQHLVNHTNNCDCLKDSFCVPNECPPVVEPECGSCQEVDTKRDNCGCLTKSCKRLVCENYPTPNCTTCQEIKNTRDECDCLQQECVKRDCDPVRNDTICNPNCETLIIPTDHCGCELKGYCIPKPCPTTVPPTCGVCQQKKLVVTEPCGCKEWICEDKPCEKYEPVNCNKCEDEKVELDKCGCSREICKIKKCPAVVPPTCSPCDKLVTDTDDCGCNTYRCEKHCIKPTPVTCPKCKTQEVGHDTCGCPIVTCEDSPCPPLPDLNCNECHDLTKVSGKCPGCETLSCVKKPCEIHPSPDCHPQCQYEVSSGNNTCECPLPNKCIQRPCPTSRPLACNICEEETTVVEEPCGCETKVCKTKPCPKYQVPECGECEMLAMDKDHCMCNKPICVPKPIPTIEPPVCKECEIEQTWTDKCGINISVCVPEQCNDDKVSPTCSPCQDLEIKKGLCNCTIDKYCVPKPCPQRPKPECNECEKLQIILGPCGCPIENCLPKECEAVPTPTCGPCEMNSYRNRSCGCKEPICEERPCSTVPPTTCDPTCEIEVNPIGPCCPQRGYCKPKPCPDYPRPTCSPCQKIVKVAGPCGCMKEVCETKPCDDYEIPTCLPCWTATFKKDECHCSKPECVKDSVIITTPPTCQACEIPYEFTDNCNNTLFKCAKPPCENKTIPHCPKCQHLVTKTDDCGCRFYAECLPDPCPSVAPTTCNSCEEIQPRYNECGCEYKVCKPKPCPASPPVECTECQVSKTVPGKCGCKSTECIPKPCPSVGPPMCDNLNCNIPVQVNNSCGCPEPGYCKPKPCPTPEPVTCDKCHIKSQKSIECGCLEDICMKKPCDDYRAPNCSDCEVTDIVKDECNCQRGICKIRPCPTPVPPTCLPCQKLHKTISPCGCEAYECRHHCPAVGPAPTCEECEEPVIEKDKCGCDNFICNPKLCEEPDLLNCTGCYTEKSISGECGCIETECVKIPCRKYPEPECNLECNYIDYGETDICECKEPNTCVKTPCPVSPDPTCNKCQHLVNTTDDCQCKFKVCKDRPCPKRPLPECTICQYPSFANDTCDCPAPICIDKVFPSPTPPTCGKCEVLIDHERPCGQIEYDCLPVPCPTDLAIPTCSPCEEVVKTYSDCGCLIYAGCKPKPCEALPTYLPCPDCEEEVTVIGECGCRVKKCQRKCKEYPDPECNECQYIHSGKDHCGCPKLQCKDRVCPTPSPPTCSSCEHAVNITDGCGCLSYKCEPNKCPKQPPVECDPVCQDEVVETNHCGCKSKSCLEKLCEEPLVPKCKPCEVMVNETTQCGCLKLKCQHRPCPTVKPPECQECERVEETKTECGCNQFHCVPINHTDVCIMDGISHKIGSSWEIPFAPHCSNCRCVDGGKCLGAKTKCVPKVQKDCVVFCKAGEWYYPPSKEECANTCGPCCGTCKKPKCNAESGEIDPAKTIGIIKMQKKNKMTRGVEHISCTNKKPIHGLRRCAGACGLAQTQEWTPALKKSNCECCKELETETKVIRLTCDNGEQFDQPVKNPTKCQCLPCEGDFGGRK